MRKFLIAAALLIAGSVSAQKASCTYIDQKAPYKNPSPLWLVALNVPKLGTTFQVRAIKGFINVGCNRFCVCSHSSILIMGASNPALDVGVFSGGVKFAGYLYSSPLVMQLMAASPAGGSAIVPMQIPNSNAVRGLTFYLQILRIYGGNPYVSNCGAQFVDLSRGLRCTIGT